ncbi:unnamed protein product [Durusdinium trenchii]|uniref:Carrier domain-containing protein n=3 Tax=Durusdinium trenchii TaxID=1381693 RepID=A0ABP0JXE9_9DINO
MALETIWKHACEAPDARGLLWYDPLDSKPLQDWSYRHVWTTASRAACRLSADGASARNVGMLLGGGPALPTLELAVLLANLVLVPLGENEPLPRLRFMLEDAGPFVALVAAVAQAALAQELCAVAGCRLMLDSELFSQQEPSAGALALPALPALPSAEETVSHIFFTSGSTNRPKGCICTLQNLQAYCAAKNVVHEVTKESVVFVASAHTFDPSLGDFLATWLQGACVALARWGLPLGRSLEATQASHVQATPAHLATVEAQRQLKLRTVALGGELMPQQLLEDWAGQVRLLNTYGVTECTVYQAAAQLQLDSSRRALGRPLPGMQMVLAAKKGDDPTDCVQEGSEEIGELWIAGPQVGLGYSRRPELTVERFHERFHHLGRCFRSGDLAVAKCPSDAGCGWQLLGRRDGMVKLRGRRVELGEIEEVLLAAAPELLVSLAAVLADRMLLIYCVLRGDPSEAVRRVSCAWLRRLAAERLPKHMVPARVVAIDAMPLTTSGKVSRRQLAERPLSWEDASGGALKGSESAEMIAAAWREVLQVPCASKHANFLALGGDSMAALRVCQQLATRCLAGASSGEFGEELPEPLLPLHLLNRPCLVDFLQHLQRSSLGSWFSDPEVTEDMQEDEEEEEGEKKTFDGELSMSEILHHAAGVGAIEVVQSFLKRDSTTLVSACVAGRRTPLHAACMNGHAEVVKLLLEAQASAMGMDSKQVQPLHLAAQGGSLEVLALLLAARARMDATTRDQQTALHFAARSGAPGALVEELLAAPVWRGKGKKGRSPGGHEALKLDARDAWGRTALHWAVVNGHRSMVLKLLELGAQRSVRDAQSETPKDLAERRAQCRNAERPGDLGASVFGDIATLLGGSASTAKT